MDTGNIERINDEELGKFLDTFDPILLKYGLEPSSQLYIDALEFEKSSQPVDYSPKDDASFVQSMCMVYGCDELEANSYLGKCRTIRDKLLNKYVHINGLAQLFNEHFIEFEWDMHSRMDFREHKIPYYRDHFFHQLRDCFMLYKLLNDKKIYEKTRSVLCSESTSKVSRYFTDVLDKIVFSVRDRHRHNHLLEHISLEYFLTVPVFDKDTKTFKDVLSDIVRESIKSASLANKIQDEIQTFVTKQFCVRPASILNNEAYLIPQIKNVIIGQSSLFEHHESVEEIAKCIAEKTADRIVEILKKINPKSLSREHFAKYLIFSSSFVASLFHDIGYPITHYMGVQKRLLNLSPSIYMLINGDKSSYEKIAAKLSQSLVFQLVKKEDIVNRCEKGDHGAFSAIIFLLHFYESGLIYSLPIEQKAVIELAALAIFNHTNRYESILGKKKHSECHYYKPIFELNPISYLLRVCDDAQEWSRTYFEINDAPSMLYCTKCNTPLIRIHDKKNRDIVNYNCRCGEQGNLQPAFQKFASTDFKRRIIFNVVPCTELRIESDTNGKCINFDYDLFQLLRICPLSTTYASLRAKELNFLHNLLYGQDLGLPLTVNFVLSFNPIFLKSFILLRYIEKRGYFIAPLDTIDFDRLISEDFDRSISDIKINHPSLYNKWMDQLEFYWSIYQAAVDLHAKNKCLDKDISDKSIKLTQNIDSTNSNLIKKLVSDAIFRHLDVSEVRNNKYPEGYMTSEKSLLFDVNFYCDAENSINACGTKDFFPDYYSDLFLFEKMNQYITSERLP